MNRIIKFRAWDKKLNVMWEMWPTEEGYFMFHPDHLGTTTHDFYEEIGYIIMNEERFDLMQFTGLKDKNGKEIFEGDIVKCGNKNEEIKVIEFINGGFGYEGNTWDYWEDEFGHDKMEVIGNIYQNPELLNPKNHEHEAK